MTTLSIQPPFPIITDIDGQPLEDGYIWIGTANLPPIGNPIAVYWDAALTIPAALPIRTRGGYPVNAGTPARLYVNSDYSILVQNKNGSTLYSAPDGASDRFSAAQISFLQAGAGAVVRTVQAKLRETVSVFDFMTAAQIAAVQAGTSTDDTAAIQAAIDSTLDPSAAPPFANMLGTGGVIYFPAGRYRISQSITIPSSTTLVGDGRQASLIAPLPSFSGPMLTDKGHAGKIFISDLRVDAAYPTGVTASVNPNYASVTACIELGNNLVQHGQAKLENLFLAGGATAYCLRVNSNVATYVDIEAGYSPVVFKNNDPSSVAAVFERCFSISATQNDFVLGETSTINNSEIEAPAVGCVPIYVTRKTIVSNVVLSLSNTSAIATPAFIEMDAGATDISLSGFNLLTGSAGSSLTNMIKDNRVNYPPYWGAAASGYSISGFVSATQKNNEILGARRQAFIFTLRNDAGTLKHRITSIPYTSLPSPFADRISGATNAYTATPTGSDATTAFAAGAKISSAVTSLIAFNTQSQLGSAISNVASGSVSIVINSSGTELTVIPLAISLNIDGVTRNYYALQFLNATSGASFNLTTLGVSQMISVVFDGYIY